MALEYQIAFPQAAPELEPIVRQLATEWGPAVNVHKTENRLAVRQNDELLMSINVVHESNYYELSFGEYHYHLYWFVRLGKEDTIESLRFCLELLGKVARDFPHDFLMLFNGELVLLKKETGQLYLNRESGVWQRAEQLAIFQNIEQTFVAYPVNY